MGWWNSAAAFEYNPHAIINNFYALFSAPPDAAEVGATSVNEAREVLATPAPATHQAPPQQQAQQRPPQQAPPAPAPAPAVSVEWFLSLNRDDQRLLISGKDFYAILQISRDASHQQVRNAFRTQAKAHHPDGGGDEELFKSINDANYVLSDYALRHAFDRIDELPEHLRS